MNDTEMNPLKAVTDAFTSVISENSHLKERLEDVERMLQAEDRGWTEIYKIFQTSNLPGMDLDQIKDTSDKIRVMTVGNPLVKRGMQLRQSYIWSKGVNYAGIEEDDTDEEGKTAKRGRKSNKYNFYHHPRTQEYLHSTSAQFEMEMSAFAEGAYLLLVNTSSKRIEHPIPMREIGAVFCNPSYSGEIWAYLRVWKEVNAEGKEREQKAWIYTDRYKGTVKSSISDGSEDIKVDKNLLIVDQKFNSQPGWTLGIPDAVAAITWARIYSEMVNHGTVMTESLARFAMKIVANTKEGAKTMGVKTSTPGKAGQTAIVGAGNDLVPLSSAGKAYDFGGLRSLAAMVATSLEVSVVALLSDPSASGSSYGSAQTLDLPTKRAMVTRQNIWKGFIERVFKAVVGADIGVSFPSLDEPDTYREAQVAGLAWNTGLFHPEELRDRFAKVAEIQIQRDSVPDGVMLPNNENSLARKDIDTDGVSGTGTSTSTASPDQGRSNGTGGAGSTLNSDTQKMEQILRDMKREEQIDFLTNLVEELKNENG